MKLGLSAVVRVAAPNKQGALAHQIVYIIYAVQTARNRFLCVCISCVFPSPCSHTCRIYTLLSALINFAL